MIVVTCPIWLVPVVGLLVSSFRPPALVSNSGWWTTPPPPFHFTWDNYQKVLTTNHMGQSLGGTLFIAVPATVIPILVAAYAAYAFARMELRGRDWLFLLVVGPLVVPPQMTLIPVLRLYTQLHLTGTLPGL